ncbi:MAG: tryptophan synthase subunit alpha [Planctomycetales bacterium]|nr:tryptophan synthase subunit alpha [Planctomycetales bacterium]
MSAVDALFAKLKAENRKAFVPFVTAGDPNLDVTKKLIIELERRGASLCELGIPYSDPIADGPIIQASYTRALDAKIKLAAILQMAQQATSQVQMPVVSMVSYAIIFRHGLEAYVQDAKAAGFAGAIVPDLLVEESAEMSQICQKHDFSLIQLITPTTPRERAIRIAESSSGFIYYVSVTGITGERTELPASVVDQVGWLREQTPLPICIGFGISRPEHVRMLSPVADGVIVGSAIVKRIAQHAAEGDAAILKAVGDYAEELVAALNE